MIPTKNHAFSGIKSAEATPYRPGSYTTELKANRTDRYNFDALEQAARYWGPCDQEANFARIPLLLLQTIDPPKLTSRPSTKTRRNSLSVLCRHIASNLDKMLYL